MNAAITLVVGAFAYGAFRTTEAEVERPGLRDVAAFIDSQAGPEDVVLDATQAGIGIGGIDGAPLLPPARALDINFDSPHRAIDALRPSDSQRALEAAAGRRLVLAGNPFFLVAIRQSVGLADAAPVAEFSRPGMFPMAAQVFAVPAADRGDGG